MKKFLLLAVLAAAAAWFFYKVDLQWAAGLGVAAAFFLYMMKGTFAVTPAGRWMGVKNPFTGRKAKKRRWGRSGRGEGANDDSPALIYVIAHPHLDAVKIGIGTDPGSRVSQHQSEGWRVVRVYNGMDRRTALTVEQAILNYWKDRDIPYGADQHQLPQGGYTETAPMSIVHPDDVCDLVEQMLGIKRRKFGFSRVRKVA